MITTYRSILCPVDLSPVGPRAVEVAYGLAGPGSVVHLLYVDEPAVVASPLDETVVSYALSREEVTASEKRAHAKLRRLVPDRALAEGVRTETKVVHDAGVAFQIAAEAKHVGADLIVMGTHGRTGFGRILMGSVAAETLRKSPVPVILVHDRRAVA
jgi:nucleotide-binding universal stress UspA family protein